ncbi:MAG: RNA-binding S4 domain-containing protein [Helicobacteraceae bacterium]|nr:RNA-binding S4 domain-containing protein [Helicobacteraceae bacterium]
MKFTLNEDYIELYKLIKVLNLVDSGAEAKKVVADENVFRNGELETRKRAKITKGEVIKIADVTIEIV